MTDLRTAAQQALEALEEIADEVFSPYDNKLGDAILALRAALAQQEEPAQEPYTGDVTRIMRDAGMTFHLGLPHKAVIEQMTRVVDLVYAEASIKAAQQFAAALAQQDEPEGSVCARCGALAFDPLVKQQAEPQGCATEEDCTKQPWCRIRGECQRKQAEPVQDHVPDAGKMVQEPVQEPVRMACPTHCCTTHGCKYSHDDCPVVLGTAKPVYPRNNGCEWCADEAEPLNLSDRAVQRRLAAQWGYVPAAQAEPVEPVSNEALRLAGLALIGLAEHDQHCDVFDLDDQGRHKACTCGLNDAIAVITQAGKSAPPQQAEPVDVGLLEYRGNSVAFIHQKMTAYRTGIDAAWDAFRANGLHPDGKTSLADMIAKHTAPPQRKPLTEGEIERIGMKHVTLREVIRAVERAHGIKE